MSNDPEMHRRGVLAAGLAVAAVPAGALAATRPPAPPAPGRQVLGFYYRGYKNPTVSGSWRRWQGPTEKENPKGEPIVDHPMLGLYDSSDPAVVRQHAVWAREAGLTGLVFGYWTRAGWEDGDGGRKLLDALHEQALSMTAYLEKQDHGVDGAVDDFEYLWEHGLQHPGWLRLQGRPVFGMYESAFKKVSPAQWRDACRRFAAKGRPEPILVAGVDPHRPDYLEFIAPLDGVHQYTLSDWVHGMSPAQITAWTDANYPGWTSRARRAGKIACATVEPGWNDTRDLSREAHPTVERYGVETLAAMWDAAIKAHVDWVFVGSFNAWDNSSEIEPSREWGRSALEANALHAARFRS